jgi:hypothetical protein
MPARGLIAAGVLLVLFALGLLVFAMPAIAREGGGPAGYAAVGFGATVFLLLATIIFLGAGSMRKLRNFSFCIIACVVAAVAGPGALLGLPFGVWAVVVLIRPEVRKAFEANRERADEAAPAPVAAISFRRGLWTGFLVFLLVVAAATVVTMLLPKFYVAIARVQLTGTEPVDPYRLQTEVEIIQSQPVLEPVATSLKLNQRWGQKFAGGATLSDDQTVTLMKRMIDVRPIRNTALVDIGFYNDSPAEAAEIANQITESYCALPPTVRANIIERAMVPSSPIRPNVPHNIFLGMIIGGVLGIFAGTWVGLISFWWMRKASPPSVQKPDRFSRNFGVAVAAVLFALISIPILIVLVAMFLPAFNAARHGIDMVQGGNVATQNAETNFSIGQAWFPQGDSIEISSVERTPEQLVVNGHYNLNSHDQASLALYITSTNHSDFPEGAKQTKIISKGRGEFELVHPHLVPGLPHVSMYANGHPFASLYFGTREDAQQESKASWITSSTPAPKFSERLVAIIQRATNAPASTLQFRLVLPTDSTAPADWLPSASSTNQFRLSRQVLLDDTAIARAGVDFSPSGRRTIEIRFTDAGAKQFEAITATNIGHQLAIVFRDRVLSAPIIQSVIAGNQCQVDGSMNASEVNEMVDCLNRVTTPTAEAWNFSPVEERLLSFKPHPDLMFGWLDLDSGTVLASAILDWESRTGYEWIRTNGFDVATTESAKHFPSLLGFDMVIAPAPTNGWDIVTPADVANNWTLRQAEPRQKQVFGAMPGQTDSFIFQTREGGKGILQILGFADNPSSVKVRYKLVQPQSTQATFAGAGYGPVVNRVVTNSLALKSGELGGIPWPDPIRFGMLSNVNLLDRKETLLRQQSIDLFTDEPGVLYGIDLKVIIVDPALWDAETAPAKLADNFASVRRNALQALAMASSRPGFTCLFETREGLRGILQILGLADNPPGVKVRYKLIQSSATTSTDMNSPTHSAAMNAVNNWLSLVDNGQYTETWETAADSFHNAITKSDWAAKLEQVRRPLGNLVSRNLHSSEQQKTLEGMPEGSYFVAKFDTAFARFKPATETVIFSLEQDGQWKAVRYAILPGGSEDAAIISDAAQPAVLVAERWLQSIDNGHYAESWNTASIYFHNAITRDKWVSALEAARQPLGDLVSRQAVSAQRMTEMPGAPDGQYVLMQFETAFANKKSAIETVAFMLEKDGKWKAAGYYIK